MAFRVVEKSYFTFESDLPPQIRSLHPSGILHAFRSTPLPPNIAAQQPISNAQPQRSEHTFAWISNSLHIESAIQHLEQNGNFNRQHNIVFIPYSNKQNWINVYPHASPSMEVDGAGKVIVYLNYRPYPNGLSELPVSSGVSGGVVGGGSGLDVKPSATKKKRTSKKNILNNSSYMPDAERDELHIEIYNYMNWLHGKLAEIESSKDESEGGALKAEEVDGKEGSADATMKTEEDGKLSAVAVSKKRNTSGVDIAELKNVVNKLEQAFAVIPNLKLEEEAAVGSTEAAAAVSTNAAVAAGDMPPLPDVLGNTTAAAVSTTAAAASNEMVADDEEEAPPFLEEALMSALSELVAEREASGKPKRRSRKRRRLGGDDGGNGGKKKSTNRGHSRVPGDFDKMFDKLVEYKNEHGDCMVQKSYSDKKLANWVRGLREKKALNLTKGIDIEVVEEGKQARAKTLTAERVERLNALGFVWAPAGPKAKWEDRFKELVSYYETNGKWPSQSHGTLGEWVHKQRQAYNKNEPKYMATKAVKLDEVNFEWTPRGNTRMSWEEGFDMLLAFRQTNGHFNVPCPPVGDDKKSNENRLYKWVQSLHAMHRSLTSGRKSGSLNDERVALLIKHGFVFH